jgi:hypothetical protein
VVDAALARARDWFARDTGADTRTEPSGSDFLSPALSEALLMCRALPSGEVAGWVDAYLPGLGTGAHEGLLQVPKVRDRTDGQLVHLVGLALSRAWQLRSLAPRLGEPRSGVLRAAADRLVGSALPEVTEGDFMATHWLVTFALLAEGLAGLD